MKAICAQYKAYGPKHIGPSWNLAWDLMSQVAHFMPENFQTSFLAHTSWVSVSSY